MNVSRIAPWFFVSLVWLGGCGADTVVVHSDTTEVIVEEEYPPLPPSLDAFFLVDSYGISPEFDPAAALAINPYVDDGWFELEWMASSWDDYWVEFYVNDRPDWDGAVYAGSQLCGIGLECDQDGLQFCRYDTGFGLSCDTGEDFVADLSPLIYVIPQTLYVFLQVCDTGFEYCEYDYYPVLFE
ncbi:hypothetical protein [Teredinibacter turnerae]|uniref:hypothetical protein n=1 Tax=Teredinibacter turnerae TaxID=2426 RepID=UPI00037FD019|nr:hypothetical protein [Teredinibacter turnerae]